MCRARQYQTRATFLRHRAVRMALEPPGGKSSPGRARPPTTLEAQLQEEGLKSMPTAGIKRIDVEEASRQERSKLDYRNVGVRTDGCAEGCVEPLRTCRGNTVR